MFQTNCWFSGRTAMKNRSFCPPFTATSSRASPAANSPASTPRSSPSRRSTRYSSGMGSRLRSTSTGTHSIENTLRCCSYAPNTSSTVSRSSCASTSLVFFPSCACAMLSRCSLRTT